MVQVVTRGLDVNDYRWFCDEEIHRLRQASEEIIWLIDRGYRLEHVVKFVGERYQFSIRQREALKRSVCTSHQKLKRLAKQLSLSDMKGQHIYIDGFNLIILLEVALSGGTLISGYDEQIRDLAGLRGSYKIIEQTTAAIKLIGKWLEYGEPKDVVIYLDAPISNSIQLKQLILKNSQEWPFQLEVEVLEKVDALLMRQSYVISSDAVILDACKSYFNFLKEIVERERLVTSCYQLTN